MAICYEYEKMFPDDLRNILKVKPIIYLPVSPLEWHGEHLAFCCDALCAGEIVKRAWEKVGGVLHPIMHLGTDGTIDDQNKGKFWGMEMFAKESLPGSIFLPKDVFKSVVFHTLKFLERNGFKLAVIYTAHLAQPQVDVWSEIEYEFKNSDMKVLAFSGRKVNYPPECSGINSNHAGVEESSELMAINSKLVDLGKAGIRNCDKKVGLLKDELTAANALLGERRIEFETQCLVYEIEKMKVTN